MDHNKRKNENTLKPGLDRPHFVVVSLRETILLGSRLPPSADPASIRSHLSPDPGTATSKASYLEERCLRHR